MRVPPRKPQGQHSESILPVVTQHPTPSSHVASRAVSFRCLATALAMLCVFSLNYQLWSNQQSQAAIMKKLSHIEQKLEARTARISARIIKSEAEVARTKLEVITELQRKAAPEALPSLSQAAPTSTVRDTLADMNSKPWGNAPESASILEDSTRLVAVRNAMQHAWGGYAQFAFGQDELKPVSNKANNWLGMGATIVDALDTLYIMGMMDEFEQAKNWVANHLNLEVDMYVSFFETTIRCLGGLLSAFELSGDAVFLEKAVQLGDRLMHGFREPHGFPMAQINLKTLQAKPQDWLGNAVVLAEVGTIQLEFVALSRFSGDPKYEKAALRAFDKLRAMQPGSGLYPLFIDSNTGKFQGDQISFGAMGDSFYEYMLKVWLYTDRREPGYLDMYAKAMAGMTKELVFDTEPNRLMYVAEQQGGRKVPKMDHLACFLPGLLALGASFLPESRQVHMQVAAGITRTCREMSQRQPAKVAPEFIQILPGSDFVNGAKHNLLRPEAMEAMFVLYRQTGDPKYREWGWEIFSGFEHSCRTASGYSGLSDVEKSPAPMDDVQQSFFLAETLKYAFLLFSSGETIPLTKYVLNTEAHPLKLPPRRS